jgi:hypothetical protein
VENPSKVKGKKTTGAGRQLLTIFGWLQIAGDFTIEIDISCVFFRIWITNSTALRKKKEGAKRRGAFRRAT